MHPLHNYIAELLADKLKAKRIVVWYDPRREFAPFIAEVRGTLNFPGAAAQVSLGDVSVQLAEYVGSFFEVWAMVEPHLSADAPETVLVYVPGCERDHRGSVLMELEKAGDCYEPKLKQLARNLLRRRYTDGHIDGILAPENVTYDDLKLAADTPSPEPPSIFKAIFQDTAGNDGLLAA